MKKGIITILFFNLVIINSLAQTNYITFDEANKSKDYTTKGNGFTYENGIDGKCLTLNSDENFNHIDNIHFKYKFNGAAINKNIGKEKNWTFFVQNDKLMCVYQMYPHIVVEFTWDGEILSNC